VTGGLRTLHTEEFQDHESKEGEIARTCFAHARVKNSYRILSRIPDCKRPRRSKYIWENNIKIGLIQIKLDVVASIIRHGTLSSGGSLRTPY
jgi:hypothetical protein